MKELQEDSHLCRLRGAGAGGGHGRGQVGEAAAGQKLHMRARGLQQRQQLGDDVARVSHPAADVTAPWCQNRNSQSCQYSTSWNIPRLQCLACEVCFAPLGRDISSNVVCSQQEHSIIELTDLK